ncbi:MAG TPA: trypsin-like peptidase domain-containing protein, partial [Bacillota bacterium]|nr:trypsin-like peptidase domain-containing protein [Bacillota bacterium]
VRFVSESMGAQVGWDSKTSTVKITKGSKVIKLKIGSNIMYVHNTKVKLDVSSLIYSGRTFVPLRAISEAFDKKVVFDRNLIIISDRSVVINPATDKALLDQIIAWFNVTTNVNGGSGNLTLREIAALDKSVVMVFAANSPDDEITDDEIIAQGSGFAVGKGLFATNLHVLQGGTHFVLVTGDEDIYEADGVVKYDEKQDLAILKCTELKDMQPLTLGSKYMMSKGDQIVTIGSPEGLQNTLSEGVVSGLRQMAEGLDVIQITAPITHGSSGAPLFNMLGYVVGVTTFGLDTANINFAVAIDELSGWVKQLGSTPVENLPLVQVPSPPPEATPGTGTTQPGTPPLNPPSNPPVIPAPVSDLPVEKAIPLSFEVTDVVYDTTKPIIYISDKGNQKVYALNYLTGQTKELFFSLPPESMDLMNNKLYVSLLRAPHNYTTWTENQKGTVAVINTDDFTLYKQFNISLDPYDIVAGRDGLVYISSGSGQWTDIRSFDPETGNQVGRMGIRQQSSLALHPLLDRIYAVDSDSSPRDMKMFTIENGQFLSAVDSPYHGDYGMAPYIRISPDGKYIFNGAGTVFYPTQTYVESLSEGFKDIAFNLPANEFYTSGTNGSINVYDYTTLKKKRTYFIQGTANNIFFAEQKLVAITTNWRTQNSSNINTSAAVIPPL